ncbi:MAG: hypothetical protein HS111_14500 [Kofleriaceae bacterium]|nr:hypothetical protein [Kofleriaceae bacterium]
MCIIEPTAAVFSVAIYAAYTRWCQTHGETALQPRAMLSRVERPGIRRGKPTIDGKTLRGFLGVRLR